MEERAGRVEGGDRQALETEGGPRAIPKQDLASLGVARPDVHPGVNAEAVAFGRPGTSLAVVEARVLLLRVRGLRLLLFTHSLEAAGAQSRSYAGVDGALGSILLVRFAVVPFAKQPSTTQHPFDLARYLRRDLCDLGGRRCTCRNERDRSLCCWGKRAVGEDDVKVGMGVQAPPKILDKRHCPSARQGDSRVPRGSPVIPRHRTDEDLDQRRQHDRVGREQPAKLPGNGGHPLAHGHVGQYLRCQVRRGCRHPARAAGGTNRATLAREPDKKLVPAARASHARKTSGQDSAVQIVAKRALDVLRKRARICLASVREKRLEMLVHDVIENRVFGSPGSIQA
jgi:hypothetical protein